ncbi:MAG: hypothetical protein B6U76_00035 [Desulfurococcales archaeon ex4484_217_2]|nr:MAG: hypothetical protein B6U76_00035 [Desulfurococcales archaeon ex4484_217_2]
MRPKNGKINIEYYGTKISMTFDEDATLVDFTEDVLAPMLIAMGYFPTNVYKQLNCYEVIEVLKEVVEEGRI